MKILLLEDDPILSDLMYDYLDECGYDTTLCMDGEEALAQIDEKQFDLLILDINVPRLSGLDLLKEVRDYNKQTPAIFITAYQDIEHLKKAFMAGCDDYIKKPFELEELGERINNLKKRYRIEAHEAIPLDNDLHFDYAKRLITDTRGNSVSLSQKEAQILHYFLNHPGRVLSPEELTNNIWEYEDIPSDATLRVYIKNLRNIIGKEKIRTIRGIGYSYEP